MKVGIGSDHAGYELKEFVKEHLCKQGFECIDVGCNSPDSCDYPDYAHALAKLLEDEVCNMGILVCGSGNGINMAVNKHSNVRSALCWTVEIAVLARQHNDANVIALPARFIEKERAFLIVDAFMNTEFEGGRHRRRTEKIPIHQ